MKSPRGRNLAIMTAAALLVSAPAWAQRRVPADLSGTRGFNYMAAPESGHLQFWIHYRPAEVERDLDYAKRLQLNQIRVLIPDTAWTADKEAFRRNLLHFVRAAHQRGMGVMPTMMYEAAVSANKERWPESRAWAADMVATIGKSRAWPCGTSLMSRTAARCLRAPRKRRGWSMRPTWPRRSVNWIR